MVERIEIGPLRRHHLHEVIGIERENQLSPWSLDVFRRELALVDERTYLGAFAVGAVVGYGGLFYTPDEAHVTTMSVATEWKRQGIATRMMLVLAEEAISRGLSVLTLEVRASNKEAQALYRKFGLAPVGVRAKYYAPNDEDALIMWCDDIETDAYSEQLESIRAGLAHRRVRS